ncbi:MAG: hypothetical protein ACRCTP_17560 [Aeromonas popoffii]|uniref:hypothetical protein n=1 Tax=Aeromonas popoffii TaxID=70856 RepID=UPI003F391A83
MNEVAEIVDVLLTEETLGLVAGVVTGAITWPVALGSIVVAGAAALYLPKEKAKQVMGGVSRAVRFKRKG